ncbi:MAG: ATP-binding protein [Oscillospiraceae bacterium]|nr:ATP-binding protein [Oscillospiraceae bacterium]
MGWDVFIAYHGTYDDDGSIQKAQELYDYLTSKGVACYFYPQMHKAKFADTSKIAIDCDKFLLVANSQIAQKLNDQGRLKKGDPIHSEIDTFYDNRIGNDRSQQDRIRVYAFNGYTDVQADQIYPVATHGVEHFDEKRDGVEPSMRKLLSWASEGVAHMKEENNTAALDMLDYENLENMPSCDHEIVCREKELLQLFDYVCGWQNGVRTRRSPKHLVCVSAYGGIGKTVLVVEFIERLLKQLTSTDYRGFRPQFILYYSAKSERLEYNKYSGRIGIAPIRKQIGGFKELREKIYSDLNVSLDDPQWEIPGILVVDNLDTLAPKDQECLLRFIAAELPPSVSVIVTTRIPVGNEADADIQLSGFPDEAGKEFIKQYCEKNSIEVSLSTSQQEDLLRHSTGNTLVLVLALRRIASKKATVRSIVDELKNLPKNDRSNVISIFMYQNTMEGLLRQYPEYHDIIQEVLDYFIVAKTSLTVGHITEANKQLNYDEINRVFDLLANYLVIDRRGDAYVLNEYARNYVLIDRPIDEQRVKRITKAISQANKDHAALEDLCNQYPELKDVIEEWRGDSEEEDLAIAKAFDAFQDGARIRSNIDFELDLLRRVFAEIEKKYAAHPYVYYQHARILCDLRRDGYIENQYNDRIRRCFDQCFILLEKPEFEKIRGTKSFPSVQWKYAQFLLSCSDYRRAKTYAEQSADNYRNQGRNHITYPYYNDACAVHGIALMKLYEEDKTANQPYFIEARKILLSLEKQSENALRYARTHLAELRTLVSRHT